MAPKLSRRFPDEEAARKPLRLIGGVRARLRKHGLAVRPPAVGSRRTSCLHWGEEHIDAATTALFLIQGRAYLHFDVAGKVSNAGGAVVGDNPDGDFDFDMTNYGDGLSAPLNVRANALMGVFLTDASPTGSSTPTPIEFNTLAFSALFPQIGQIFFIGDGLESDSNAGQPEASTSSFRFPWARPGCSLERQTDSDGPTTAAASRSMRVWTRFPNAATR
ncbi:MAG TPA: hypothetical protein VEL28_14535 [Candidatus Binatia bacterium]|nr:hypothetical protein [Candidatus Binatia bacterium]